jgi:hypothetical protein
VEKGARLDGTNSVNGWRGGLDKGWAFFKKKGLDGNMPL